MKLIIIVILKELLEILHTVKIINLVIKVINFENIVGLIDFKHEIFKLQNEGIFCWALVSQKKN